MANCVSCKASNLGMYRTPLVIVDGEWYCEKCLKKEKGNVVCAKCGNRPFDSNEHFKTVNGQYLCTACMEKQGIIKKYDYIAQSVAGAHGSATHGTAAAAATSAAAVQGNGASALSASLRMLLDGELSPGESIVGAINGNTGEGMAYSKDHLFILKSGTATGSLTGRKCKKFDWVNVRDFVFKLSPVYCWVEVIQAGHSPSDFADVNHAKKSDTAITFLAAKKDEFERFVSEMKSLARLS